MLLAISPFIPSVMLQAAPNEKTRGAPEERAVERGSPALFFWGDVDGDGRLELAAVGAEGTLQLLAETSDGRFEDVTHEVGLSGIDNAALVLWMDYDLDGRLDLFVGARAGTSRLYRNEGGAFADMGAASGLVGEGTVSSADWLDHDGDGRPDLHLVTAEGHGLFRGLEGGFFERVELPELAGTRIVPGNSAPLGAGEALLPEPSDAPFAAGSPDQRAAIDDPLLVDRSPSRSPLVAAPSSSTAPTTSMGLIATCLPAIRDQANPGSCIQASTTPTLGRLYPISANLFVALGGDVGIGTTSPSARLHVAGTARITDTLTLAPAGDTALDVSTGSIYKAGALFIHTKGGGDNTALGQGALASVTVGSYFNTASGVDALRCDTTGDYNTACGANALRSNTTGSRNTAIGNVALYSNTTGYYNTACGAYALSANTTGHHNTASGGSTLRHNTTGYRNTASGDSALYSNTTGDFNTASGAFALFYNTIGSSNTATGGGALFSNTTGSSNTASGVSALVSNTTGSGNTASGVFALFSNTTGFDNTASGSGALLDNTTGGRNTATGRRALYSNTTGPFNTASGAHALYSNTTGGSNTACGAEAMLFNTTGYFNTASGAGALRYNTTGSDNTAIGTEALFANTTGINNTASGQRALFSNTAGYSNTASGRRALYSNTTGNNNTANGFAALRNNTTGSRNVALGYGAGYFLTTGSDNIAIGSPAVAGEGATVRIGTAGTHTRALIAGIRGVTTGVADAIPVLVDSAGQLGTVSSSRRFKEEIRDMGDRTERLLALRPVVFRYKPEVQEGERPLEYGLIAEEVAEVFPDLVVHDEEGEPFTVKYHLLSAMLLNELEKLHGRHAALAERVAALETRGEPVLPR